MINQVMQPGKPSQYCYYLARVLEFLKPTLIFGTVIAVTALPGLTEISIFFASAYAILLCLWARLAIINRPIVMKFQSSLPGAGGSGELWQLHAQITEQIRAARWIDCGNEAVEVEDQETDDAAALFKHPLINLMCAPKFITSLFKFDDIYKFAQGAPALVVIQYPDLYYSGSRSLWHRIESQLQKTRPDFLPQLSSKEALTLKLLVAAGKEMKGLELIAAGGGVLKLGIIYVLLAHMEERGLIKSEAEESGPEVEVKQRVYRATEKGERALSAYLMPDAEGRERPFKDFRERIQETRADRFIVIAGLLNLLSTSLKVLSSTPLAGEWSYTLKLSSVILFALGIFAFIFAALAAVYIEFSFMPRFLRSRED